MHMPHATHAAESSTELRRWKNHMQKGQLAQGHDLCQTIHRTQRIAVIPASPW